VGPNAASGAAVADIFVRYASSDRDWAEWIGRELGKLGHFGGAAIESSSRISGFIF
jgi:hypothetical protein